MKKILLAEDDFDFANVLKQYLELHLYAVTWAKDGEEALTLFQQTPFHICVLDVMMPKMDGFTLAEKIVTLNPKIPFVFLTARKLKDDKIKGLQLGADDYIVKPFEADELVLRLNNILKRSEQKTTTSFAKENLQIGNYILDQSRFQLLHENNIRQLTEKEVALILFLLQHKNQILKRTDILHAVWGNDDFFSGRSMDVFISRLRKYFKDDSQITIESIRNIGLEFKILD
jgi:DNA-binding response OmpR family regulator